MTKSNYRYIDHPSDVVIEASGKTLNEALAHAATAMFNYMCDLESIDGNLYREIFIDKLEDPRELLYTFMDECLYLYGSEYFIAKHITVNTFGNQLKTSLIGDIFDKDKHIPGREVKAITKHGISVEITDELYTLMILVDI
ncbi:Archease protein family (MTH1598/TM1083) [Babesia microti strain RI]|uniref:Archease protein family (MTH1598/TM1083) n=1 Tax=Babesia microti (strain RI) TaxID=1133968 RepID=I7IHI7_BABMR|nr:Archease protein family (MTH1598/TM1083) [Babesia microti strain RI]CCF75882.1 Archease protein family (MTH1598/TM1083) [Babesia microti strain RI]|eukprot:XP_012650290.1 Archease protein family (MTH1598/TM1083) [Babesia microti strain RI]